MMVPVASCRDVRCCSINHIERDPIIGQSLMSLSNQTYHCAATSAIVRDGVIVCVSSSPFPCPTWSGLTMASLELFEIIRVEGSPFTGRYMTLIPLGLARPCCPTNDDREGVGIPNLESEYFLAKSFVGRGTPSLSSFVAQHGRDKPKGINVM